MGSPKGRAFFNSRKEVVGSNRILNAVGPKPRALVHEPFNRRIDVLVRGVEVIQEVVPFLQKRFTPRRLNRFFFPRIAHRDGAAAKVKCGSP